MTGMRNLTKQKAKSIPKKQENFHYIYFCVSTWWGRGLSHRRRSAWRTWCNHYAMQLYVWNDGHFHSFLTDEHQVVLCCMIFLFIMLHKRIGVFYSNRKNLDTQTAECLISQKKVNLQRQIPQRGHIRLNGWIRLTDCNGQTSEKDYEQPKA